MSRKFLFLIAATVVVLYFSVILFMLSPLHAAKEYSYMSSFPFRQVPNVQWCKKLRWQVPPASHVVALVSFPGSGNTWLRYLLQQATGILTGSIYMDHGLRLHGFPAENVTDGSVLVVKTHEAPPHELDKFKSAILLIRNPKDAILADFNRLHKGHVGTAPKSAFKKKSKHKNSDWTSYVATQLIVWEAFHRAWLRFPGTIHVVFYEVLVRDTKLTLQGILEFLHHNITEEDMTCALAHREGIYRRKNKLKDFDPFTPDMYKELNVVKNRVLKIIYEYQKRNGTDTKETQISFVNGS